MTPIPWHSKFLPFFLLSRAANKECPGRVQQAFSALKGVFERGNAKEIAERVQKPFGLCKTPKSNEWDHFLQYARNAWTSMSMCDYPYPSTFLAPLPAWPIKAACKAVMGGKAGRATASDDEAITGLANAVALPYTDSSNPDGCKDMYALFIACADQTGCGTGNDATAWDFQMCSDFSIITESTNTTDMFPERGWTADSLNQYCEKTYGVVPQPMEVATRLGAYGLESPAYNRDAYSKIIFSNGMLDPWHAGGYLKSLSKSLIAVKIKSGAHHLDLRGSDKEHDPRSVIVARKIEKAYTHKWMNSYRWQTVVNGMGEIEAERVFEKKITGLFQELEEAGNSEIYGAEKEEDVMMFI